MMPGERPQRAVGRAGGSQDPQPRVPVLSRAEDRDGASDIVGRRWVASKVGLCRISATEGSWKANGCGRPRKFLLPLNVGFFASLIAMTYTGRRAGLRQSNSVRGLVKVDAVAGWLATFEVHTWHFSDLPLSPDDVRF